LRYCTGKGIAGCREIAATAVSATRHCAAIETNPEADLVELY